MAANRKKNPPLPPLRQEPPLNLPAEYYPLLDGMLALTNPTRQIPPREEFHRKAYNPTDLELNSFGQLETAMRRRAWTMIQEHLPPILKELFVLNPAAAELIQAAAPAELQPLAQALPQLNGLLNPPLYDNEPMHCYLQILGSLPETPICALQPDWTAWFLLNGRRGWFPRWRFESEPGPTPLETQLQSLTAAVLAAPAAENFPKWPDLAIELQAHPWRPTLGPAADPNAAQRSAVPLTEVMTYAKALHAAAAVMQLPPETYAYLAADTPEQAAAAIQAAGRPLRVDMGTLSELTPERLKELVNAPGPAWQGEPEADLWHFSHPRPFDFKNRGGRGSRSFHFAPHTGDPLRLAAERLAAQEPPWSRAELAWAREAMPQDPEILLDHQDQHGLTAGLGVLAVQWQTTPQAIQEYLEGKRETPQIPEKPALCPHAAICPSHCARRQEQSPATAFPLTYDGDYGRCRWHSFQEKYGENSSPLRAAAAYQELKAAGLLRPAPAVKAETPPTNKTATDTELPAEAPGKAGASPEPQVQAALI